MNWFQNLIHRKPSVPNLLQISADAASSILPGLNPQAPPQGTAQGSGNGTADPLLVAIGQLGAKVEQRFSEMTAKIRALESQTESQPKPIEVEKEVQNLAAHFSTEIKNLSNSLISQKEAEEKRIRAIEERYVPPAKTGSRLAFRSQLTIGMVRGFLLMLVVFMYTVQFVNVFSWIVFAVGGVILMICVQPPQALALTVMKILTSPTADIKNSLKQISDRVLGQFGVSINVPKDQEIKITRDSIPIAAFLVYNVIQVIVIAVQKDMVVWFDMNDPEFQYIVYIAVWSFIYCLNVERGSIGEFSKRLMEILSNPELDFAQQYALLRQVTFQWFGVLIDWNKILQMENKKGGNAALSGADTASQILRDLEAAIHTQIDKYGTRPSPAASPFGTTPVASPFPLPATTNSTSVSTPSVNNSSSGNVTPNNQSVAQPNQ